MWRLSCNYVATELQLDSDWAASRHQLGVHGLVGRQSQIYFHQWKVSFDRQQMCDQAMSSCCPVTEQPPSNRRAILSNSHQPSSKCQPVSNKNNNLQSNPHLQSGGDQAATNRQVVVWMISNLEQKIIFCTIIPTVLIFLIKRKCDTLELNIMTECRMKEIHLLFTMI